MNMNNAAFKEMTSIFVQTRYDDKLH
jgi:hypothetical protein